VKIRGQDQRSEQAASLTTFAFGRSGYGSSRGACAVRTVAFWGDACQ